MSDAAQIKKRKMSPEPEAQDNVAPVAGLLVKRHSEKARLPTRGSALAAGYDLYRYLYGISVEDDLLTCTNVSAEKKTIPAHGKALIDTQISIAVPVGTYGRVAPRSGLG